LPKKVITVTGEISPEELGIVSMNDYILCDFSNVFEETALQFADNYFKVKWDEKVSLSNVGVLHRNTFLSKDALMQTDVDMLIHELGYYKRAGGKTILDLSTPSISNNPKALKRISEETGVNIIASTGFYDNTSIPTELKGSPKSAFMNYFREEITNGIGRSTIKPGNINIGITELSVDERNALSGAAAVCKEFSIPLVISLEVSKGEFANPIIYLLKGENVDFSKVIVAGVSLINKPPYSHVIKNPEDYKVDLTQAKTYLDAGLNISITCSNTYGYELLGDYDEGDWALMSAFVLLIDAGYCEQIVTGNACRGKIMLHDFGGEGFARMLYYTLPMLRDAAGVSDYAIRKIFYENPARILAV